jgi:hypothetical protein
LDCWDQSQGDRLKGEEELRPFEEAGWWYRIVQKTQAKRYLHCRNSDGTQGQWKTEVEWCPNDWTKTRGNTRYRNVFIRVLASTRRKKDHTGEDNAPKREGESPYTKRY